jgi:hypothetical protein
VEASIERIGNRPASVPFSQTTTQLNGAPPGELVP